MKHKILIFTLLFILLSACKGNNETIQPTSTSIPSPTLTLTPMISVLPTSELSPYYGEPEPIEIVFDGKIYKSQIGTTSWILEVQPNGATTRAIGDAFAIITPVEPIITKPDFSFTLKLSIPINPIELWYALHKVSEQELNSKDTSHGAIAWNPDYSTQTYHEQTALSLLPEQELNFSMESGFYVLEIHASWGNSELQADYGFLLEVQE